MALLRIKEFSFEGIMIAFLELAFFIIIFYLGAFNVYERWTSTHYYILSDHHSTVEGVITDKINKAGCKFTINYQNSNNGKNTTKYVITEDNTEIFITINRELFKEENFGSNFIKNLYTLFDNLENCHGKDTIKSLTNFSTDIENYILEKRGIDPVFTFPTLPPGQRGEDRELIRSNDPAYKNVPIEFHPQPLPEIKDSNLKDW